MHVAETGFLRQKEGEKSEENTVDRGGGRFFLDGQCSENEYISAIDFFMPIMLVTYIKDKAYNLMLTIDTEKNNNV